MSSDVSENGEKMVVGLAGWISKAMEVPAPEEFKPGDIRHAGVDAANPQSLGEAVRRAFPLPPTKPEGGIYSDDPIIQACIEVHQRDLRREQFLAQDRDGLRRENQALRDALTQAERELVAERARSAHLEDQRKHLEGLLISVQRDLDPDFAEVSESVSRVVESAAKNVQALSAAQRNDPDFEKATRIASELAVGAAPLACEESFQVGYRLRCTDAHGREVNPYGSLLRAALAPDRYASHGDEIGQGLVKQAEPKAAATIDGNPFARTFRGGMCSAIEDRR